MVWTVTVPSIVALALFLATLREWRARRGFVLSATRAAIVFLALHLLGSTFGAPAVVAFILVAALPLAYMTIPEVWVDVIVSRSALKPVVSSSRRDGDLTACVGREALCVAALRPEGRVQIDDTVFEAISDAGYMDVGQRVVVTGSRGGRLLVCPQQLGGNMDSAEKNERHI